MGIYNYSKMYYNIHVFLYSSNILGGFFMAEYVNLYVNMWKNFINFSDRTDIKGYWVPFLFNIAVALVIGIISAILPFLAFLGGLYGLAATVPGIAMTVRRLRDCGRPWTHIFFSLIPLAGGIILIVFLCGASVPDDGTPVV